MNSVIIELIGIYFTAINVLVFTLCGLNWVSNLYWGSNIHFDFIKNFHKQLIAVSSLMGFSVWVIYLVLLITLMVLHLWLRKIYLAVYNHFKLEPIKIRFQVYFLLFILFNLSYISISYSPQQVGIWKNEPLINALTTENKVFGNELSKLEAVKDSGQIKKLQNHYQNASISTNVIIVMVDSFRADRTSVYGYERETTPFLNQKYKENKIQKVDYFTSTCSESTCGIYSAFSSRKSSYLGPNLFDVSDVLKMAGYTKKYILSARHDYNELETFYSKNRDLYISGLDFDSPYKLYQDDGVIHHLKQLDDYEKEQPMFLYLHLMSAHQLGKNKEQFKIFKPNKDWVIDSYTEDREVGELVSNSYDNGMLQTDYYIEEIFKILDEKKYLEDAIVLITGDHGEGMGERNYYAHTYFLFHEDINIPLMMYATNGCEFKNTRYGTHIDIAPTILDCLNLAKPETWQGRSLLMPYEENRLVFHQTIREEKEVMVVLENQQHMYKMMASLTSGKLHNYRLYDLYNDPQEANNLINNANQELVKELKAALIDEFD